MNFFEVPDVDSIAVTGEVSVVLRMLAPIWTFAAVAGLAVLESNLNLSLRRQIWLWHVLILITTVSIVMFFGMGRSRFPLALLLLPLAAAGAVSLVRYLGQQRYGALKRSLLCGCLAVAVGLQPILNTRSIDTGPFANLGAAAARRGDLNQAIGLFRRAIVEALDLPAPQVNLGRAMMQVGQYRTAIHPLEFNSDVAVMT